jgi:hypothetical protein
LSNLATSEGTMVIMKRDSYVIVLLIPAVAAVVGCGLFGGECFWRAAAEVWEDTDGDGVRDPGEPPLPNINVIRRYTDRDEAISEEPTGSDGTVEVSAISSSCDWEKYLVTVELPPGYTFSTAEQVAFTDVDPGEVIRFGLKPDQVDTLTPTSEPTQTPLPTTEAIPTEEPSPTDEAVFRACDVMTRSQAESILGALVADPWELEYVGAGPGVSGPCIFEGALNGASVILTTLGSPEDARVSFDVLSGGGFGEPVSGTGKIALWREGGLELVILSGRYTLSITMTYSEGARDQVIQIGQIAVVRLP